jgi:hypothetical protein
MLGVITHFSNYISLLALLNKKSAVSNPSSVITDIRNLHTRMRHGRSFRLTIKHDCDPNYLDVSYRIMASSLGYTAQFTHP